MTVRQLVELLQTFDQNLPVCYELYSEFCLIEDDDIEIRSLQEARPDGWVHRARPDKTTIEYLVLPGN